MSLQVDESGRRGRSRSPSGRRIRDEEREYERERDRSRGPPARFADSVSFPDPSQYGGRSAAAAYDYDRTVPSYRAPSPALEEAAYRGSRDRLVEDEVRVRYSTSDASGRREKEYRYQKERVTEREREKDRDSDREREMEKREKQRDSFQYLPQKYANVFTAEPNSPRSSRDSLKEREKDRDQERKRERERDRERERERERDRDRDRERRSKHSDNEDDLDLAYGSGPVPPADSIYSRPESPSPTYAYAQPKQWEYGKPEEKVTYSREEARYSNSSLDPRLSSSSVHRVPSPGPQRSNSKKYHRQSLSVVTVEPGAGTGEPRKSAMKKRDASPQPPTARMSSLSVQTSLMPGGPSGSSLSLAAAPGSPLLESYHGTYQSISPMPSPLLLATAGAGAGLAGAEILEALSPIGSDTEGGADRRQRSRRARFHDPVDDAARLAKALKGDRRAPETEPLIEILPGLTHEQVMELRAEYKRLVKTGSERKGVNVAKHIRARLKDEDPNLMKACYATALGRWESEAYWANFWYQGDKTRRELLIEALVGRTNDEIRAIKDGFADKKYGDSLTRCMRTELKEDKFKKAVLLVLDEQRMDETDAYGRPVRIDPDLVREDVHELHRCIRSEKGGETAMINIVVLRSDVHLREMLRAYTARYHSNFAKDALKKSGNLVGEVLAHILNGVINKPVRDAMLLQHALTAGKKDDLRRELLTSRLVRYHWDHHHMAAVKLAFRERYGQDLQEAVRHATSGEWGEFCQALCINRMPDEVKRIERVEVVKR